MDNGCLVVRKWQVEPAKIERRRWNRRRTTALQTLTNRVYVAGIDQYHSEVYLIINSKDFE